MLQMTRSHTIFFCAYPEGEPYAKSSFWASGAWALQTDGTLRLWIVRTDAYDINRDPFPREAVYDWSREESILRLTQRSDAGFVNDSAGTELVFHLSKWKDPFFLKMDPAEANPSPNVSSDSDEDLSVHLRGPQYEDTGLSTILAQDTDWQAETVSPDGTRTLRVLTLYADGGLSYREGAANSKKCLSFDGQWNCIDSNGLQLWLWENASGTWSPPDSHRPGRAARPDNAVCAVFHCERKNGTLCMIQCSEHGFGSDANSTEILFLACPFGGEPCNPEQSWKYEALRPDCLELWLTQPVYSWIVSNYTRIPGIFGGRQYLSPDYKPERDSRGNLIAPEQCVLYTVTAWPDYADGGAYITRIDITDPAVHVYGLNVESSFAEVGEVLHKLHFEVRSGTASSDGGTAALEAEQNGLIIRFTPGRIVFFVEVTNRDNLVF